MKYINLRTSAQQHVFLLDENEINEIQSLLQEKYASDPAYKGRFAGYLSNQIDKQFNNRVVR